MGAPALSYVAGSTHRSVGPINGAVSPFRVAFTIDVAMLERQPSALRRAAALLLREVVTHGEAIALERTGPTLTVRRFDALGSFHREHEIVTTYQIAFGLAVRDTLLRLAGINPVAYHAVDLATAEGSLRCMLPFGDGTYGPQVTRARVGVAAARIHGGIRRALVVRPIACVG